MPLVALALLTIESTPLAACTVIHASEAAVRSSHVLPRELQRHRCRPMGGTGDSRPASTLAPSRRSEPAALYRESGLETASTAVHSESRWNQPCQSGDSQGAERTL